MSYTASLFHILIPGHYRQAIPLAVVQADTLAIAKQPSNTDKSNSTANGTLPAVNKTEKVQQHSLLLNSINLPEGSAVSNPSQAIWRIDHQYSKPGSSNDQGAVYQVEKGEQADDTSNCEDSSEGKHPNSTFIQPELSLSREVGYDI